MPELRRSARVAARPAKEPEAVTEQPPTKKVKTAQQTPQNPMLDWIGEKFQMLLC